MLGILQLDTAFPRIRGDIGATDTFDFPVRHRVVTGASVERVVHAPDPALLGPFIDAGRALAREGCHGITTTCGFLARWQDELAAALPVPVLASPLVAAPLLARLAGGVPHLGIVTYSAADLDGALLGRVGLAPDCPIRGVAPDGYFAQTIRYGATTLDRDRMEGDAVAAASGLVAAHPQVRLLLLECANMPPYRDAIRHATGLPVFDAALLCSAFHTGLVQGGE